MPPPPRTRRWPRIGTIVMVVIWGWILVRLAPHLGAVFGIESGGELSPSFEATTLDGRPVSSESLRGRVVLVNVWATWCPPCRIEMPLLEAMYQRHRERGLVVLGLSVDTKPADSVRAFLEERKITYPVAIVGDPVIDALGGVTGYPTSFLIDREGRIRHRALGPLAMASFEPAVRRALGP
ncbi:MAG: TlpA disulfide reductase family protein [Gemmatimonadales bacterium]